MEKTKVPNAFFIMLNFKRMPYEPSKKRYGWQTEAALLLTSEKRIRI